MGKNYNAQVVINIALNEVGYLEKSSTAYKKNKNIIYEKTKGAGSDNYTKYGKEMHDLYPAVMDFPAYWCDCFVDWCFHKAYGVSGAKALLGGNFDDYTVNSKALYVAKGAYIKRGKGTPKKGDQIFFNNGTRVCHTGIVYDVDKNYVYTVEGNTSVGSAVVANGGGVSKKKYALSYNKIDGYGRPPYRTESIIKKLIKSAYKEAFPVVPPVIRIKSTGEQVKKLQKFLNWYGDYGLIVDGDCGEKTTKAIKMFQKAEKLTVDGKFGPKSLEAAKAIKK